MALGTRLVAASGHRRCNSITPAILDDVRTKDLPVSFRLILAQSAAAAGYVPQAGAPCSRLPLVAVGGGQCSAL